MNKSKSTKSASEEPDIFRVSVEPDAILALLKRLRAVEEQIVDLTARLKKYGL